MASKILFLSILLLSFCGMSAKPHKDQMRHDNEEVLSQFSPLNEETGLNKHTSSFKINNDDDYENHEMDEEDKMNKNSPDIDEVMDKTEKRDGQGSMSETKTSKKNQKEKYDDVQIPDAILAYRGDGIELGLSDDVTPQDRFQEALSEHNKYRRLHDAPTLKLNQAMSESAADYAKSLVLRGSMDHSSLTERRDQGENLFMECSKTALPSPNDAIMKWYSEVCGYNFQDSKSNPGKVTGHFTQLVWKPTKEIGIGYAIGVDKHNPAMKCFCVVARYKPAGNVLGWFSTSVGRRELNNTCSKKGNVLASEPDEKPLHTTQSDFVTSTSERLSSEVFPHQRVTKFYEANNGMSVPGDVADGTPQEKQSSLPLYESNGENMGVPSDDVNKVPTDDTRVPSEQETSITQPATNTNLYDPAYGANATDGTGAPSEQGSNITPPATNTELHESTGENMGVPSDDVNEMLEVPTDGTEAPSKQESGADPARMVSKTSTAYASFAQSDTSSSTVPSEQESSLTPPGMNSGTNSQDITSVDDATLVKAPSVTGTPISTAPSQPPSQPPSNVVAPVGSGITPRPVTVKEEPLKDFQQAILREHNSLRFRHLSKLLHLDANLNSDARNRASELAKKPPSKGAFRLLPGGIGQNTYLHCGEGLSGANVTKIWYDEICRTGFLSSALLAQKAAQFNQVVWKETQTIGASFALGMDASGKQLCRHVVVLYKPGANLDWRDIQLNVKPGSFDARIHCRQLLNQGGSTVPQPGNPARPQGNVKGSSPKLGATPQPSPSKTPQTPGNAATTPSSNTKQVAVPTASQTDDDFEKIALKQHNIFRKRHGAKALKLDRHLCKEAKKYAKKLSERGPDKEPIHSLPLNRNGQGESLFVGCNADIDSADITRIWYNEVCHYDFTTYQSTGSAPVGHFAQIVWKGSTKFGIAREFKGDSQTGCAYVVARYSPKKMSGQEEDNIDKGRFTPAVCRVDNENGKGATLTQRPEQFIDDALGAHNEFRLVHGVSPMSSDKNLNAGAQKHADKLARKSINDVIMSNNRGENIYTSCKSVVTGRSVTEAWYWDVCNYDFANKKSKDGIADHFTQLVWKGSTKVGFGVATAIQKQKTCVFVVARYFLPGNVAGQYKFNVFKGSFNEKQCAAHVFTPPQHTVGDMVPSTSHSSVNNGDSSSMYGTSTVDGENPDGSLTSQLDKQAPTAALLSSGVPTVGATVSPKPPSKELLTPFKPPKVNTNKPATVNTGTPQSAPSTLPTATTISTLGTKPFKTGPSKQVLSPSTAKTAPSTTGALPAGGITAGSVPSTSPTTTTIGTKPPSKTISGSVSTQQPALPTTAGTTTNSGTSSSVTGSSTGTTMTTPSKVTLGATKPTLTSTQPATTTSASPNSGTSVASPNPTGPSKVALGTNTQPGTIASPYSGKPVLINTGPSKQVLVPLTIATSSTSPPTTSGVAPPTTSGVAPPSPVSPTAPPSTLPVIPAQNGINLNKHLYPGLKYKVGKSVMSDIDSESVWPATSSTVEMDNEMMSKDINKYADDMDDVDSRFKNEALENNVEPNTEEFNNVYNKDEFLMDKTQSSRFNHDNDMDSSFKEQPLQDNINAQNSQFNIAGSSEDSFKGQLNQFNHVKNNDMDSSFKEQPLQYNRKAQNSKFNMAGSSENNLKAQNNKLNEKEPFEDNLNGRINQFNHIKDDMDNMNQDLQDNTKAQSHPFNHYKMNMDKSIADKAPSKINYQILRPWPTQHSRHHYRDHDLKENQKYLAGKVTKTHQQQNWDKWGQYYDDMDLMGSDMTSWNDQGLEGGSNDISGTYKDLYGDMMDDYKEPYASNGMSTGYDASYEDNKGGNYMDNEGVDKGMDSTYSETNNYDTDMMYKDTESKVYPKGSMDINLVGHSQVSKGKQIINGLTYEGDVGLPMQQYADELGQVRGLPSVKMQQYADELGQVRGLPSVKKEDNLKIKRKTKKTKH